jgi:hypothetical protein
MKHRLLRVLIGLGVVLLMAGCKSLFPTTGNTTDSRWKNFEDIESAFAKVTPQCTGTNELIAFGFHPTASPNVKILTYVDIINYFMPNPGIRKEDLDAAVRACIDAKEHSHAYLLDFRDIQMRRHGNLFLDVFGFKRRTHETGWQFRGLILMTNGTVVYKLSSGEPQVSRHEQRTRPLGPLQEVDLSLSSAFSLAK